LTPLRALRFLTPPSEPDVRVSTHPALHEPMPLGYATAHWCSLVWIRSTRDPAHSGSGHSTSVFTNDLPPFHSLRCELAAALRHVAGFPGLGLLRRLRHVPAC
jgi:hypothetical protein